MKTTILTICFFACFLIVPHLYAQETKGIALKLNDVSIKDALRQVERSSNYFFLYNNNLIDVDRKVTVDVEQASIEKIIDLIFQGQKINYVVKGRQIVISPLDLKAFQDNRTIAKGRVTDEWNEPLSGVAVLIEGTTSGTITDTDGNFVVDLDSLPAVLQFSFLGMEPRSVNYNGQENLPVVMFSKNRELDEIIVVAYGRQSTETVTGAIQSININKISRVSSPHVSNIIQSSASGLLVVNTSGEPGEKPELRIRGDGSINYSNEPLWVIDGVIFGNSSPDINPNDIESISVLKDAAASALYGSRASNGIILVETKTGNIATSSFKFISNTGVAFLNQGEFSLMNGQELYDYISPMINSEDQFPLPSATSNSVKKGTNWLDIAMQPGIIHDYNLSYQGGSGKTMIYTNWGYYNEDGAVVGHKWEKFSGRINLDYNASKRVKLVAKLSGIFQNKFNSENALLSYAYLMLPWDNPYNEDGSIKKVTGNDESPVWYSRDKINPLYDRQFNYNKSRSAQYMSDFRLELKLTDWLTFSSGNRLHTINNRYENIIDARSLRGQADNGSIENNYGYRQNLSTSNVFRFSFESQQHRVFGLAAYEYSKSYADGILGIGKGIYPSLEILNATSTPKYLGGGKTESAFLSQLSDVQYNYGEKYMAQLSYRRDGSSRFGVNKRFGDFYSVSVAWALHNEKFMKSLDFIDQLKLRGSYGSVGNANITDYVSQGIYNVTVQYDGVPGGYPRRLANPDLTWESNYNTNVGVDAGLFGQIDLSVDLYNKKTENLLQDVPLPMVSGFYWFTDNVGAIQNRGVEFLVKADIVEHDKLKWNADFNISFNKNKVLRLNEGKDIITGNKIIREGWDMNTWYLRKWAGVNSENGDPLWERVVTDENGNKVVEITNNYSRATLQNVGSSSPRFFGGFTNQFCYGTISLTANFNFVAGNKVYNSYREFFDNDGAYPSYNSMKLSDGWSRWEKPGDEATHPKPVLQGNKLSNKVSSRYIENGSFIRLRQLVVAYSLPETFLERVHIKEAVLKLSGENLFTITDFSGMDPEVGIDGYSGAFFPVTRKYIFGLDISF
ncbi:SusC/RagA family TonB-linked outer membrane protein [Maribellus sp. CM-23]|uniref:SusC/RagA family TonB-linked outer membrane protein n=1 Tax=Maribellus sp. CM-23 TaxID=2781026 RepID=UPI001F1A72E6|nr:SusC/RagA family TonB-linked outer membrane protein [Maribellus sp. CM-23]MCE4565859.1 SusC/RagA family TonB-linked outer membrane protein [Maribellus sp. CM-23]